MAEKRVTLAEPANQEDRNRRTQQKIREEDRLVKRIFREHGLRVVGERTPIAHAGWDTTYCVYPEREESRLFRVTVRAALSREALEGDIRSQITKRGKA
jgi:hypothetical protein